MISEILLPSTDTKRVYLGYSLCPVPPAGMSSFRSGRARYGRTEHRSAAEMGGTPRLQPVAEKTLRMRLLTI
jgi:hypothetical protein